MTGLRGGGAPAALAALLLGVAGCAGLAPGGNIGQVVEVDGIGTAEVATFDRPDQDAKLDPNANPNAPAFMDRWTGALTVLGTDDGQLLVVWNGGPAACWVLTSIHFVARGANVDASVGERSVPRPGTCEGERRFRAVFVPRTAAPPAGETSYYPTQP